MRNYIGLACTPHDSAIAIVNSEGEVVFAEATERYAQSKRGWNVPPDNMLRIKELLEEYCEEGSDLVVSLTWGSKALRFIKTFHPFVKLYAKKSSPHSTYLMVCNLIHSLIASVNQAGNNLKVWYSEIAPESSIEKRIYDHHLTHAAAACYSSPFEEAVCAVVDGYGEGSSTGFFQYLDGKITPLRGIKPSRKVGASLGTFYACLCRACGFYPVYGEEWKVMGLAPYGTFDWNIYKILRPMIKVKNCRLLNGPNLKSGFSKFYDSRRLPHESPLNSADLAFTGQKVFCETFQQLLSDLCSLKISENLILAGGCALNSSWNGRILEETPFKDLYVFCAPADDGNAVGSALLSYYEDNPYRPKVPHLQLPYLGEKISPSVLEKLTDYGNMRNTLPQGKKIHERAAELLAEGKIVGWIQGRAEFGPRALGNRSILADPRNPAIKETLNAKIKNREMFRPYAPSVLHEYGPEYFENYQESPYMERTLRFRKEVVDRVQGVVHVDGTGRLQTVKRSWNEKFYDLIAAFKNITGIPMVLNTSFNVMGKPIVHSVEDAVAVFYTTGLDTLAIEDYLFEK